MTSWYGMQNYLYAILRADLRSRRRALTAFAAGALLVAVAGRSMARSQAANAIVASPDGRLRLQLETISAEQPAATGALVYSVTWDGKPLIERSALSLDLGGTALLGSDVRLIDVKHASDADDYIPLAGKTGHVHDTFNSVVVTVAEPGPQGRTMMVFARAYNGALAFRYIVPSQAPLAGFHLKQEHTEFRFNKDALTWALCLPNFRSAYESEYIPMHMSGFGLQGGVPTHTLIGLPLLMHLPGVAWMAIAEADVEDYAKMYLTNPEWKMGEFVIESAISPHLDDPNVAVESALPHLSAWRVLLVGDEPGRFVESNVINSLNPPSRIEDTSWIHPGKAAWSWWNGNIGPDGKEANTTATLKYYVDFAAQSGFPYVLVDGGWSAETNAPPGRGGGNEDITRMAGNVDVPELVRFGAQKGVKIWVWIHYKPTSVQMESAFPLYESWGVAGVKIDFVEQDDQQGIAFYYKAAQLAAKHHLMVDFHGTTTPWGLDRTFPNVLGVEAVMGMEYSKWSARDNPIHRTTVPFTRMLAGFMDYTPGGFRNTTQDNFVPRMLYPMVLGTRAHQLALFVVDFAPFEMIPDVPSVYENQPEFQFLRDVPVTWDEIRVLQGIPGETVTIARRSGEDWYLGSITNWTARDVQIPLNFLGNGEYSADVYRDAEDADRNPQHVLMERMRVHSNDKLVLHLAPGGGCAIRFVRKP